MIARCELSRHGGGAEKKHKFERRAKIVRGYKAALRDAGFEAPAVRPRARAAGGDAAGAAAC